MMVLLLLYIVGPLTGGERQLSILVHESIYASCGYTTDDLSVGTEHRYFATSNMLGKYARDFQYMN